MPINILINTKVPLDFQEQSSQPNINNENQTGQIDPGLGHRPLCNNRSGINKLTQSLYCLIAIRLLMRV